MIQPRPELTAVQVMDMEEEAGGPQQLDEVGLPQAEAGADAPVTQLGAAPGTHPGIAWQQRGLVGVDGMPATLGDAVFLEGGSSTQEPSWMDAAREQELLDIANSEQWADVDADEQGAGFEVVGGAD